MIVFILITLSVASAQIPDSGICAAARSDSYRFTQQILDAVEELSSRMLLFPTPHQTSSSPQLSVPPSSVPFSFSCPSIPACPAIPSCPACPPMPVVICSSPKVYSFMDSFDYWVTKYGLFRSGPASSFCLLICWKVKEFRVKVFWLLLSLLFEPFTALIVLTWAVNEGWVQLKEKLRAGFISILPVFLTNLFGMTSRRNDGLHDVEVGLGEAHDRSFVPLLVPPPVPEQSILSWLSGNLWSMISNVSA